MSQTPLIPLNRFTENATLMIQGCTSDAGKSVMVAALCRILANRGVKNAPFKPQNMALNSAVTEDGGEIGRAQALQAIAARVPSHTDMNPILLKPNSDTGAQVIVHGKALSNMQAVEYHDYKTVAMNAVLESYKRLNTRYGTIMVEGAGSPAEINLRSKDIANMGFAEKIDCPVVIVADIDRGGVFAHLVGTLKLLSETEQKRVVGFIINRFRGDKSLLDSGLDWLEKETGKPVLGVIPYLPNLFLDAEDAINSSQKSHDDALNIIVPVLPRISNHTDFDALRLNPNVNLKFVSIEESDRAADLVILPGSKSVIQDMQSLLDNEWDITLNKHLRYGGKVLGICGGYQMLGHSINDPLGIENNGIANQIQGLGLLNINTTLNEYKQLKNTKAKFTHPMFESVSFTAYEIHCGESSLQNSEQSIFSLGDNRSDGCLSNDHAILGTYLHGLFDSQNACQQLLKWAGIDQATGVDLRAQREHNLERIALALEENLRPDFIQQLFDASSSSQFNDSESEMTAQAQ